MGVGAWRGALRFFLPLLRPHRWALAEVCCYQLLSALMALALPLLSGCVVSALDGGREPADRVCRTVSSGPLTGGRLVAIVAFLTLAQLIDAGLGLRRTYLQGRLHDGVIIALQVRLFARLQRLSHRFHGTARVGDVVVRLSEDAEIAAGSMAQVLLAGSMMTFAGGAAAGAVLVKSPVLGALVLLVVPPMIVAHRLLGSRLSRASAERQQLRGEAVSVAQEALSAHSEIKALGLEDAVVGSYRTSLVGAMRARLRLTLTGHLYAASATMATTLGRLVIVGVGGYMVLAGADPSTVVTLLLLAPSVMEPASVLASLGQELKAAGGSIERVREVLDEPIGIEDRPDAVALPSVAHELCFRDVSFAYAPGRDALHRIDLRIPAGAFVAVVGPSGAGKSTLVNLLLRFWDPDEGRILFDGQDVRQATLASLRRQIGVVFQETFIFNASVRENIALGRPGASEAEIQTAARAACLESFVGSLPDGYDTRLGERGVCMSIGQRQRLGIARALVRDPAVIVLDEATSALDPCTELDLLDTLEAIAKGRTTVAVTHRLALAARADLVIAVDHGRVMQQGTHFELLQGDGLYRQLWKTAGLENVGADESFPAAMQVQT